LDLDKPYPGQLFTVLIWGENRAKFGTPEETYRNKNICVTGRIESYRGEPEIITSDPAQLSCARRRIARYRDLRTIGNLYNALRGFGPASRLLLRLQIHVGQQVGEAWVRAQRIKQLIFADSEHNSGGLNGE
jgi:hypothetical protein